MRLRRPEFLDAYTGDHRNVSRHQGKYARREKRDQTREERGNHGRIGQARHRLSLYLLRANSPESDAWKWIKLQYFLDPEKPWRFSAREQVALMPDLAPRAFPTATRAACGTLRSGPTHRPRRDCLPGAPAGCRRMPSNRRRCRAIRPTFRRCET